MMNKLTPLNFIKRVKYQDYWLFKCECGNEKIICFNSYKNGSTRSCGCLFRVDITNQKFNFLKAIKYIERHKTRGTLWLFECDCGNQTIKNCQSVKVGNTKSCGCKRYKGPRPFKDGLASFNHLYNSYKSGAKKRELEFSLTPEEFLEITKKNCTYCNIEPTNINNVSRHGNIVYNGLDRINNLIGYILTNCVPCCKICNYGKRDLTEKQWYEYRKRIHGHFSIITKFLEKD